MMWPLLVRQLHDRSQVKGRTDKLSLVQKPSGVTAIRYRAPNGIVFFIEPRRHPYGEPAVWCREAKQFPASQKTHTFGEGYVCLGHGLMRWDLTRILVYCDGWAAGYDAYRRTGKFPPNPYKGLRSARR